MKRDVLKKTRKKKKNKTPRISRSSSLFDAGHVLLGDEEEEEGA